MQIVKVPGVNSEKGKTKGCERAGNAILNFLKNINTNDSGREIGFGKLNLDSHGNSESRSNSLSRNNQIELEEIHLDNKNLELTNELIFNNAFEIFENQDKAIFLGGDHSISYSLVRGFFECCKMEKKFSCLIVFDAHADIKIPKEEFASENDWLKRLIQDGGFPSENILLVGAGNFSASENEYIKQKRIRTFSMNQFKEDLHDACDSIMEFSSGRELYLSLDFSVVDKIFAPASESEVGGLTSREFIYLINRISKMKNLRGIDIVGINSEEDEKKFNSITTKLGAKVLGEFL